MDSGSLRSAPPKAEKPEEAELYRRRRAELQLRRIRLKKFKTTIADWADCPAVVLHDFDESF